MPINSKHPDYTEAVNRWKLVRDCIAGQDAIKGESSLYLPVPPGMSAGTMREFFHSSNRRSNNRDTRYGFYLEQAQFPEIIGPAVDGIQGLVHNKPPAIKLPEGLSYIEATATVSGAPLEVMWQYIVRELTITGRLGVLCEVVGDELRYATYTVESIINWQLNDTGQFEYVVLEERFRVPKDNDKFETKEHVRFRHLFIDPTTNLYTVEIYESSNQDGSEAELVETVTPSIRGQGFTEIPFYVIDAMEADLRGLNYGPIPILPMCRVALSLYRRSADYNRSLYLKADPQPYVTGVQKGSDDLPDEIGGDAFWSFSNPQARVGYLDIDGQGIPHQRQAVMDDYNRFVQEGINLLDSGQRGAEAADAIRRRQGAKQVTVVSLIISAGEAINLLIRKTGELLNVDVPVTPRAFEPNLDFTETILSGQELFSYMQAKAQGAPISFRTIHDVARERRLTSLSFEEEMAQIRTENQAMNMAPPEPPTPPEEEDEPDLFSGNLS